MTEWCTDKVEWDLIPGHMQEHVRAYVMEGRPIGNFLTAIFSNNLMEAATQADDTNIRQLADYARFLYNYVPSACYGSPENVAHWIEIGGANGLQKL